MVCFRGVVVVIKAKSYAQPNSCCGILYIQFCSDNDSARAAVIQNIVLVEYNIRICGVASLLCQLR